LIKLLDEVLKHGENSRGRIAGLELGDERMGKEFILRVLLIRFQGGIEN
jgi:hypothetical protein